MYEDETMQEDKEKQQLYEDYVKQVTPTHSLPANMAKAFLVGGLICVLGQGMWDGYHALGLDEKTARTAVSITLIFITALLTGIGVFDSFAKHAGAGTLVPITGFANAVVAPAMEFRQEGFVTGTAVKLFTVAGPVLVFGISASVIYGLVYWVWTLIW